MGTPPPEIRFRIATSVDVPAMAACRLADRAAGPVDARMAAYFEGKHHPQQALPPRVGYLGVMPNGVIGYIAGHLTTRHGCSGELQYLFVSPEFRRLGVATTLLRLLADWFGTNGAQRVCVCVDADSLAAKPFYESAGALPFRRLWYAWNDISICGR